MPVKSAKQYRFMQMMAHSPGKKQTKGPGPSPEVAKEMIHKTAASQRKKFAKAK